MFDEFRAWAIASFASALGMPIHTWAEEPEEEVDGRLENPYMTEETTEVVRNCLDATLATIWPVTLSNAVHALQATQILITHHIHLLEGNIAGLAFELAQTYREVLTENYDVARVPGTDIFQELDIPDGYYSIRDELHAFVAESLDGEYEAAVRVVTGFALRFEDGNFRAVELLAHLIISLAYAYAFDTIEEAYHE